MRQAFTISCKKRRLNPKRGSVQELRVYSFILILSIGRQGNEMSNEMATTMAHATHPTPWQWHLLPHLRTKTKQHSVDSCTCTPHMLFGHLGGSKGGMISRRQELTNVSEFVTRKRDKLGKFHRKGRMCRLGHCGLFPQMRLGTAVQDLRSILLKDVLSL